MPESRTEHSTESQMQEQEMSPAMSPQDQTAAEHSGVYTHFRGLIAASGRGEPRPEQFSSLLGGSEFSHPANDAQKARVFNALQQQYGNRYVQRVMASGRPAQTNPAPDTTIQRKEANAASESGVKPQIQLDRSGGQPLEEGTRTFMESRFGYDFRQVRTHNDTYAAKNANELNAQAFTSGRDIYFGTNNFQPSTTEGQRLLAHELAHTIQQTSEQPSSSQNIALSPATISHPDDPLEREAENVADYVINGNTVDDNQITSIGSGVRETIARQSTKKSSASEPESGEENKLPIRIELQNTGEYSSTREISKSFDYGSIEIKTIIETNYSDPEGGALGPYKNRPAVNYHRYVTIRTKSGGIVNLHIHVRGSFSFGYKLSGTDSEFYMTGNKEVMYDLDSGKETEYNFLVDVIGMYYLDGYLASDRTPVNFNVRKGQYFGSDDYSVFDNLNGPWQPKFMHSDLTPEQQFQAIVDVLEIPQPKEKKEERGRQVELLSEEEFEQMTQEEKEDLALEKAWEEFSVGNVVKGVGIGLAVIGAAFLAVLAVKAGIVGIALGGISLAAGVLLAVGVLLAGGVLATIGYGLYKLLGELFGGLDTVPEILKNIALTVGMILGAIVFVAALFGTTLTGLGLLAVGLFVAAVVIGAILVWLNIDKASKAESVEDFQRHVTRAAREAEGAIELAIILVGLLLWGKFARGRESKAPPEREIGIEPSRVEPIDIDPIEGGSVEFIGANKIRFTTRWTSEIGEIISRRPGSQLDQGEVLRVRLRNGQEESVIVEYESIEGFHRYRLYHEMPEIFPEEPIPSEEPIRVEEMASAERKVIPKPTPDEYVEIDKYTETFSDLHDALEFGETARIKENQRTLDDMEALALKEQGKGGPYNYLWEHIERLAEARLRIEEAHAKGEWSIPIEIETPSGKKYVEGLGSRYDVQATNEQFGTFRGRSYTEIEQAIGRPPDQVDIARDRITWQFDDNTFIHIDIPRSENILKGPKTQIYELNLKPHAARTIAFEGGTEIHLSDQGIVVPRDSTPAHIEIRADDLLWQRLHDAKK